MKEIKSLFFSVIMSAALVYGCKDASPTDASGEKVGPPWRTFTTVNSRLVSDSINAIVIDFSNQKYFATDQGVSRLTGSAGGRWFTIKTQLTYFDVYGNWCYKVNALTIGADATLWYGLSTGGGLRRSNLFADERSFVSFVPPEIPSDVVYSLTTGFDGTIWLGTASGVARFVPDVISPKGGTWTTYWSGNSLLPSEPIRSIAINPLDHSIWFGTSTQGVVSYDGDLDWNIDAPVDRPLPILAIAISYANLGWFGTYGDWAYRYNLRTFEWLQVGRMDSSSGQGMPSHIVRAVAVDQQSNDVWFGTDRGLVRYRNGTITLWDTSNAPLPSEAIRALAFDKRNNLWIGTARGVAEFNELGIQEK